MKFSIVTISFNQADFLERTIQSVLSQQGDGFEIEYILVDPGSTDGSRDIIERYRDRISKIIFEEDRGPADGLNKGFAHATGDVFYYLNSDDTLEAGALATVAQYLRAHLDVDVVSGNAWLIDRYDNRLRRLWSEPFHPVTAAYGCAVQVQPATFFRATAFANSGGFNTENRLSWDGELLIDMYYAGARFALIDKFLGTYRIYGGTITSGTLPREQFAKDARRRFERLMRRQWRPTDHAVAFAVRIYKHIRDPRATMERIIRGRVFQRKAVT